MANFSYCPTRDYCTHLAVYQDGRILLRTRLWATDLHHSSSYRLPLVGWQLPQGPPSFPIFFEQQQHKNSKTNTTTCRQQEVLVVAFSSHQQHHNDKISTKEHERHPRFGGGISACIAATNKRTKIAPQLCNEHDILVVAIGYASLHTYDSKTSTAI